MKTNRMQSVLFGLFLLFQMGAAHAAWVVETKTDSMTDETKKSAIVINEEGHSLTVYRQSNGSVWINFSLSNQSPDTLSHQKPPIFRVDKDEPHDIATSKRIQEMGINGVNMYAWEPKWVNVRIWHGDESKGRLEELDHLMHGSNVVFRYSIFTGGYKETTFSLDGAGPAIASALGISVDANSDIQMRAKEFHAVWSAALNECTKDKSTFSACSDKVNSCMTRSNDDLAIFQKCMH